MSQSLLSGRGINLSSDPGDEGSGAGSQSLLSGRGINRSCRSGELSERAWVSIPSIRSWNQSRTGDLQGHQGGVVSLNPFYQVVESIHMVDGEVLCAECASQSLLSGRGINRTIKNRRRKRKWNTSQSLLSGRGINLGNPLDYEGTPETVSIPSIRSWNQSPLSLAALAASVTESLNPFYQVVESIKVTKEVS